MIVMNICRYFYYYADTAIFKAHLFFSGKAKRLYVHKFCAHLVQFSGNTVEHIVDIGDVAEHVCAQYHGVGERPFQVHLILVLLTVIADGKEKAPVLTDPFGCPGACHRCANIYDRFTCGLLICDFFFHEHDTDKAFFRFGVQFRKVYVLLS